MELEGNKNKAMWSWVEIDWNPGYIYVLIVLLPGNRQIIHLPPKGGAKTKT